MNAAKIVLLGVFGLVTVVGLLMAAVGNRDERRDGTYLVVIGGVLTLLAGVLS